MTMTSRNASKLTAALALALGAGLYAQPVAAQVAVAEPAVDGLPPHAPRPVAHHQQALAVLGRAVQADVLVGQDGHGAWYVT